jgi:protein-S-isoprenylcysteine O-methyltransferase Ste14
MSDRWTPPALGARGEGWVALQFVVLGLIVVAGSVGGPWPAVAEPVLRVTGAALLVVGAALALAGMRTLGASLTPYPKPGDEATMREHGSYRLVRHPIYGGLLLGGLGWACLTSPLALVPVVLLAAVFAGKSAREEAWLDERYPGYPGYRARVRRRFVPFVW